MKWVVSQRSCWKLQGFGRGELKEIVAEATVEEGMKGEDKLGAFVCDGRRLDVE